VGPTVTSTPPKRITGAPSVTGDIAPITTYQTAMINPGRRRRRATTAQKASADRAAFLSASITIHPVIKSHTWTKRRSASRQSHRRRVRQPLPATHINHLQNRAPHITITSHVTSFAGRISAIANTFQSAHNVIDADTGESHEHAHLIRGPNAGEWLYSTANEFGRLTKGVAPHMPSGSKTMRYIYHHQFPPGRHATYARFVTTERPHKAETKRVCLTLGGNLIHYPDKVSTPTADLSTVKLLLKSVISTPGARFATFDLKYFYLGTPMMRKEYMRIPLTPIPQTIIDQYALLAKTQRLRSRRDQQRYVWFATGWHSSFQSTQNSPRHSRLRSMHQHLDYGPIPPNPSPSHLSSTISGSNTPTVKTPSTCSQPSKNSTPS
jgi:hypothetical protein